MVALPGGRAPHGLPVSTLAGHRPACQAIRELDVRRRLQPAASRRSWSSGRLGQRSRSRPSETSPGRWEWVILRRSACASRRPDISHSARQCPSKPAAQRIEAIRGQAIAVTAGEPAAPPAAPPSRPVPAPGAGPIPAGAAGPGKAEKPTPGGARRVVILKTECPHQAGSSRAKRRRLLKAAKTVDDFFAAVTKAGESAARHPRAAHVSPGRATRERCCQTHEIRSRAPGVGLRESQPIEDGMLISLRIARAKSEYGPRRSPH